LNVRVVGNIDDAGLRSFLPMMDACIKAPDGSFIVKAIS
jgi:hypothetical protein